jgi:hypothetical protein
MHARIVGLALVLGVLAPSPSVTATPLDELDVSIQLSISPSLSYYPENLELGVEVRVGFDVYDPHDLEWSADVEVSGSNGYFNWEFDAESPLTGTDSDIEDENVTYDAHVVVIYDWCPEEGSCIAFDSEQGSHYVVCLYPDCATSGGGEGLDTPPVVAIAAVQSTHERTPSPSHQHHGARGIVDRRALVARPA